MNDHYLEPCDRCCEKRQAGKIFCADCMQLWRKFCELSRVAVPSISDRLNLFIASHLVSLKDRPDGWF